MIDPSTIWTHTREGYQVRIEPLGNARLKDANDAQWQQAVGYRRADEGDNDGPWGSVLYVRGEADFRAKFRENDVGDER